VKKNTDTGKDATIEKNVYAVSDDEEKMEEPYK
jgi:hypothetical protein